MDIKTGQRNNTSDLLISMEPATGLEPVTPALRERCSAN